MGRIRRAPSLYGMQPLTLSSTRPYLVAYLRSRPLFFTLIRSQEAALFKSTEPLLAPPVLDVGCGDGFFARLVYGTDQIDTGLDLSGSRISEAESSGAYARVVTYDGLTIPFPDASFGSAISNCVLEHVVRLDRVVSEVHRVIRPEGRFLVSVMTDRWEEYMLGARVLGDRYRSFMRQRQEHQNLLSRSGWDSVFHAAGFQIDHAVGYLSSRTALALDGLHYLSLPALVTRALTGRWVVVPELWSQLAPILDRGIDMPIDPNESAAIFYVLTKT